jgi:hypothetical protein
MGPCDREWFLNGQRQPWARGGRTWPALPLAPGHTAASQDQAMTAGNHISQPSRWVHPSGSATDVAPALSPRPVQSNASMTDANAQPGLQHGVGFLPAGPLPTGQRLLTGSPGSPTPPRGLFVLSHASTGKRQIGPQHDGPCQIQSPMGLHRACSCVQSSNLSVPSSSCPLPA